MAKLTKNIVERTPVREKVFFLFDDSLPGFCVRIAPNGKRHYYQQYMKHKKTKRFPLGMHGIITAEAAREKAIAVLAQINAGADPVAESVERTRQPTVRDLAERYMKEHAAVHCKPATAEGYEFYLRRTILPALGDLKVADVTRKDISAFHSSLADTPYNANRSLEIISKMFNLAEMWGLRPDGTNPRRHIRKFEEKKRERYLTKEESRRLGEVLTAAKHNKTENPIGAYCIEVLLYTGCRCGEIQTLKWEYIDWENSCLRLPDTKTGARVVYVGQNVLDILRDVESLQGFASFQLQPALARILIDADDFHFMAVGIFADCISLVFGRIFLMVGGHADIHGRFAGALVTRRHVALVIIISVHCPSLKSPPVLIRH